jgi:hypothetical protein
MKHGLNTDEIFQVERGTVSRSIAMLTSILELLRVTDPRSVIRVYPCQSVVKYL